MTLREAVERRVKRVRRAGWHPRMRLEILGSRVLLDGALEVRGELQDPLDGVIAERTLVADLAEDWEPVP